MGLTGGDWDRILQSMRKSSQDQNRDIGESDLLEKISQLKEQNGKEYRILEAENWSSKSEFHRYERHVDRVVIEVRISRGDLTWVLREVERIPDGSTTPDRIRFDFPQGKVDFEKDGLDESRFMRAAHRELIEETNFDLQFIDSSGNVVYPKQVHKEASHIGLTYCSQIRKAVIERDKLGGSFPGLTRVTNSQHYVCEIIEGPENQIDISQPIVEHNTEAQHRNFFRWFPCEDSSNWEFGRNSSGIQVTHPFDLLDVIKQQKRLILDDGDSTKSKKWSAMWKQAFSAASELRESEAEDGSKSILGKDDVHQRTKWANSQRIAKILDDEHRNDKQGAKDRMNGIHNRSMETSLHSGHRQTSLLQFSKILNQISKHSGKSNPQSPYGQLTREFDLRMVNDALNSTLLSGREMVTSEVVNRGSLARFFKDQTAILEDSIFGLRRDFEAPEPNWPSSHVNDEKKQRYWKQKHGFIVKALEISCEKCGVDKGQPCPKINGKWANSLFGNKRKKNRKGQGPLGNPASISGIDADYLSKIRDQLVVATDDTDWQNIEPSEDGWSDDWKYSFPLVCNKRLQIASQHVNLQEIFEATILDIEEDKAKRAPSRYFSNKTLVPITLRNRIKHSLQRYIVSARNKRKEFHRSPNGLGMTMLNPIMVLFDMQKCQGINLDSREEKSIDVPFFEWENEQLLVSNRVWKWSIFNQPKPGLNLRNQEGGFIPSVQVDTPLIEIYSAFCQGFPAVLIRRDYYQTESGELWSKPNNIPENDQEWELEYGDQCITPGQLVQSASEVGTVLMNQNVQQIRSALGILEADTFLNHALPNFLRNRR